MTPTAQITRAQEHRFYRYAVQASLEQFYNLSKLEATRLVRAWWKRLSENGVLNSDLFLHAEPLNTAGEIAEMSVIPITSRNREAYHRILEESRDRVLAQAKPKPTHKELEIKKKAAEHYAPPVHVVPRKPSVTGGLSIKAFSKRAKAEKSTQKEQAAFS